MNGEVDEFQFASEYVDAFFDTNQDEDQITEQNLNLDYLLATQGWRKGRLDDIEDMEEQCRALDKDTKERLLLEYLLGRTP